MGLPARSPISDRFQGTMYMTFGCSRSPVTVAVPNSSRSPLGVDFWPGPEAGRGWRPADPRAAGAESLEGAGAAGGVAAAAGGVAVAGAVTAGAGAVAGSFD